MLIHARHVFVPTLSQTSVSIIKIKLFFKVISNGFLKLQSLSANFIHLVIINIYKESLIGLLTQIINLCNAIFLNNI